MSLILAALILLAPVHHSPPAPPRRLPGPPPIVYAEKYTHDVRAYLDSQSYLATQAYLAHESAVSQWNAAVALRTAQEAAQAMPVTAPQPSYSPSPVSGACGGATNGADQFIQRESGGNPSAYNPSGAWGCYQIMPGTWAGAGCNDLGAYGSASPAAQAACASRLDLSAWNL